VKTRLSVGLLFLLLFLVMIFGSFAYLIREIRRDKEETIRVTFDFGQPQKNRIAVLFFHNLSGNTEDEYLSEGLTEDIITRLAKIEGLNVRSMTDVMRFKDKPSTIREIGRILEVDAVLEGSLRKAGQTLLVSAQLIDVGTGLHIWAERYERKISIEDLFGLQNELATKIAQAAHLNLTQSAKENLTQRPTASVQAYEFYLKGKFYHMQMTPEGNWMAIEMLQKAIETDSDFAMAYAELGDAYLYHYHIVEPPDKFWLDQAVEKIQKALTLDEKLPEAHRALGHFNELSGEYEKAAAEYQKALAQNPNYTDAQIGLGQVYCALKKYDLALNQLMAAQKSHPELNYVYYAIGSVYAVKGEKDQAISWLKKAVDKGFSNVEHMNRDSFLDSIRKDARFVKLMSALKKKKKKQEES
jgi:TolB-like protein/lipopolysaccharide biosynthesis regulator YciM